MSRNMKAAMAKIFEKLKTRAKQSENYRYAEDVDSPRFIDGSESECDALKNSRIVFWRPLPTSEYAAVIENGDTLFLCISGSLADGMGPNQFIELCEQNAGILSVVLADTDIVPTASPDTIVNVVFGVSGSQQADSIMPLFGTPTLFRFGPEVGAVREPMLLSITQALCAHRIAAQQPGSLWSKSIVSSFQNACVGLAARYAGDALLAGSFCVESHHLYLQIYRAFEGLFRVHLVESFLSSIDPEGVSMMDRRAVSDALDDKLMWRVQEFTVIQRLLSAIGETNLASIISCCEQLDGDVSTEKVAKLIYGTRNSIAHGSLYRSPPAVSEQLLMASLLLLQYSFEAVNISPSWIPEQLA